MTTQYEDRAPDSLEPADLRAARVELTPRGRKVKHLGLAIGGLAVVLGGVHHATETHGTHIEQPSVINTTVDHNAITISKDGTGPSTISGVVAEAYPAPEHEDPSPELTEKRAEVTTLVTTTLEQEKLPSTGLVPGEVVPVPEDAQHAEVVPGDPNGVK